VVPGVGAADAAAALQPNAAAASADIPQEVIAHSLQSQAPWHGSSDGHSSTAQATSTTQILDQHTSTGAAPAAASVQEPGLQGQQVDVVDFPLPDSPLANAAGARQQQPPVAAVAEHMMRISPVHSSPTHERVTAEGGHSPAPAATAGSAPVTAPTTPDPSSNHGACSSLPGSSPSGGADAPEAASVLASTTPAACSSVVPASSPSGGDLVPEALHSPMAVFQSGRAGPPVPVWARTTAPACVDWDAIPIMDFPEPEPELGSPPVEGRSSKQGEAGGNSSATQAAESADPHLPAPAPLTVPATAAPAWDGGVVDFPAEGPPADDDDAATRNASQGPAARSPHAAGRIASAVKAQELSDGSIGMILPSRSTSLSSAACSVFTPPPSPPPPAAPGDLEHAMPALGVARMLSKAVPVKPARRSVRLTSSALQQAQAVLAKAERALVGARQQPPRRPPLPASPSPSPPLPPAELPALDFPAPTDCPVEAPTAAAAGSSVAPVSTSSYSAWGPVHQDDNGAKTPQVTSTFPSSPAAAATATAAALQGLGSDVSSAGDDWEAAPWDAPMSPQPAPILPAVTAHLPAPPPPPAVTPVITADAAQPVAMPSQSSLDTRASVQGTGQAAGGRHAASRSGAPSLPDSDGLWGYSRSKPTAIKSPAGSFAATPYRSCGFAVRAPHQRRNGTPRAINNDAAGAHKEEPGRGKGGSGRGTGGGGTGALGGDDDDDDMAPAWSVMPWDSS
jgi:hypothetical protein